MTARKIALVLGATGGVGGEMAAVLLKRGWMVRGLKRGAPRQGTGRLAGVEWIEGDAMVADDVAAAATGAALIVHGVNPPGYKDWDKLVLPMIDNTIAAARESGARILLPGTIYNYGPDAFPVLSENAPQNPLTRKGAIRVEMERRLRDASAHGVRTIVLRCGDFFGPTAGNNWFSQGMVKPGAPLNAIVNPATPGVGHAWAYLPDVAETMMRLAERDDRLGAFELFHFAGHYDADGAQMAQAIRRAAGDPDLTIKRMPWLMMTLASPFVTFLRELREMHYLWRVALRFDNRKLVATLGLEPHTPLDDAVRASLVGLGCLPEAPARHSSYAALAGGAA